MGSVGFHGQGRGDPEIMVLRIWGFCLQPSNLYLVKGVGRIGENDEGEDQDEEDRRLASKAGDLLEEEKRGFEESWRAVDSV